MLVSQQWGLNISPDVVMADHLRRVAVHENFAHSHTRVLTTSRYFEINSVGFQ